MRSSHGLFLSQEGDRGRLRDHGPLLWLPCLMVTLSHGRPLLWSPASSPWTFTVDITTGNPHLLSHCHFHLKVRPQDLKLLECPRQ